MNRANRANFSQDGGLANWLSNLFATGNYAGQGRTRGVQSIDPMTYAMQTGQTIPAPAKSVVTPSPVSPDGYGRSNSQFMDTYVSDMAPNISQPKTSVSPDGYGRSNSQFMNTFQNDLVEANAPTPNESVDPMAVLAAVQAGQTGVQSAPAAPVATKKSASKKTTKRKTKAKAKTKSAPKVRASSAQEAINKAAGGAVSPVHAAMMGNNFGAYGTDDDYGITY